MRPLSYGTVKSADICRQQTQLYNKQFQDIYHHRSAIEESHYVFHQGNQLQQQWQAQSNQGVFVIAETGFGSGLNFLTTRQLWQNCSRKPRQLHYISTEQWLLTPAQLNAFYKPWPDLHADLEILNEVFAHNRAGFHNHRIDHDITLTLLLGDATACLKQLTAQIDAWFLDGFTPAKNPDMWSEALFSQVGRLSKPGSTFATFTAASQVRRNLQSVGFEVSKSPGFKGKRERLTGQFKAPLKTDQPQQSWAPTPAATPSPKKITIIGSGIAGLCLAHSAKQNGLHVTLIDRSDKPLAGASGNPYALLMPYLTAKSSPEALFYWRAFESAVRFYPDSVFSSIGVNETTNKSPSDDQRLQLPNHLIQHSDQGFYYPGSGYIDTAKLTEQLSAAIDTRLTAEAAGIEQTAQGSWSIINNQHVAIHHCDLLVVAAGIRSLQLLPDLTPFTQARRGQTELYQLSIWPEHLKQIQLNHGYLIPLQDQQQILVGGDHQHVPKKDWFRDCVPDPDKLQLNLNTLKSEQLCTTISRTQHLTTRSGIRCHTLDHLPLCGPLVDEAQFTQDYADLHHGRHWQHYPAAKTRQNLYVLTGLGSRGYTSAPLLAEHLIAMIMNRPLPLEYELTERLHPNRFLYRRLKKPPDITS